MRKKYFFVVSYIAAIHLVLIAALLKSNFVSKIYTKLNPESKELTHYYQTLVKHHQSQDELLTPGTIIFMGDSITQGLATSVVASPSINYGIGGDTTYGLLKRIKKYKSLNKASVVVFAIGVNDLSVRTVPQVLSNYQKILKAIPPNIPIIVNSVLPIDESVIKKQVTNKDITKLNHGLKDLVAGYPNASYINSGAFLVDAKGVLSDSYHIGDGLHLNRQGYKIWIDALKVSLVERGLVAKD